MYDDDNDYGNYNWDPDHNMWVDYTAEQFTGENPYLGYPEYEDYSENNAAEDYNDTNLNRGSDSNTYSGRSPFTFSGDIRSLSGMMAQS